MTQLSLFPHSKKTIQLGKTPDDEEQLKSEEDMKIFWDLIRLASKEQDGNQVRNNTVRFLKNKNVFVQNGVSFLLMHKKTKSSGYWMPSRNGENEPPFMASETDSSWDIKESNILYSTTQKQIGKRSIEFDEILQYFFYVKDLAIAQTESKQVPFLTFKINEETIMLRTNYLLDLIGNIEILEPQNLQMVYSDRTWLNKFGLQFVGYSNRYKCNFESGIIGIKYEDDKEYLGIPCLYLIEHKKTKELMEVAIYGEVFDLSKPFKNAKEKDTDQTQKAQAQAQRLRLLKLSI